MSSGDFNNLESNNIRARFANVDSSSIAWYLKEANKIDILTHEEEDNLVRLARAGDEAAKSKLIGANLRFVVYIAKKYQTNGISLLDLINEGNMGLIKAADKFDPDRGFHFISYAVWWIRQAIISAISQKASLVRIPLNKTADLQKIKQVQKILENRFGRRPSPADIAEELDMDGEEINYLRSLSKDYLSLDFKFSDSEDLMILNVLADQKGEPPDKLLIDEALKNAINAAMESLTESEKSVIEMRYGLNGHAPMTLKQIGGKFNFSKERIRQIEKKAIKRMGAPALSQALKIFLQD